MRSTAKLASAILIPWLAFVSAAPGLERPNIVLVTADDQGWGDMAYNGHPTLQTPNFDEAAAAGLRFDRFYAAAPVCSPTRASILTGRHPNRSWVPRWGYPLRPQEITLPEVLKSVGYMTAHFGKWHLGSVRSTSPARPGAHGFDHWFSAPNFYDNDAILSRQGRAEPTRGESSMVAAEAAIEWMRPHARSGRPFFAVVWFGSPHAPHRAAESFRRLYADQPDALADFYGEISGMDHAFGALRDALDELGVRENTILWYSSDNGALPRVGSAGESRGRKGEVYDGGLLVPAVLEWPEKIRSPRATKLRCNTADIYPTLLDVVGIEIPDQPPLDGVSLRPLIEGRLETRPRAMGFWDYPAPGISTPSAEWMAELLEAQRAGRDLAPHESSLNVAKLPDKLFPTNSFRGHAAWIDGDWKLHRVEGEDGEVRWELYNLAADPAEANDLASREAERTGALRAALETWLESVARSVNGEDYPEYARRPARD